jgi:hypothetical protein
VGLYVVHGECSDGTADEEQEENFRSGSHAYTSGDIQVFNSFGDEFHGHISYRKSYTSKNLESEWYPPTLLAVRAGSVAIHVGTLAQGTSHETNLLSTLMWESPTSRDLAHRTLFLRVDRSWIPVLLPVKASLPRLGILQQRKRESGGGKGNGNFA